MTELRKSTPITYSDLSSYNVFVIPEANIPFKTTEQAALVQYVQNGGSIFFIADHYNADRNKNRWDAAEVFNGYRRGAYADPTSGMSAEEAASAAMQDFVHINQEMNISILLNIHHVELAMEYADRIIGIRAGKIVYDGPSKEVTPEILNAIYAESAPREAVVE